MIQLNWRQLLEEAKMKELNMLLAQIAEEEQQDVIDAEYESYMDNMMAQYNMMMYEAQSYDYDATFYGEH